MNDFSATLAARGFTSQQIGTILEILQDRDPRELSDLEAIVSRRTADLIRVIFLRVERDSAAGCALRRALGFSDNRPLSAAAADFGVSKQHLHNLQEEIETKLGTDLTFIARAQRAALARRAAAIELPLSPDEAGPSHD